MTTTTTTTPGSAFWRLAAVNLALAAGATGLAWWSRPVPVDPATLDLAHARTVLDIEHTRLGERTDFLNPERRASVSGFVSLQTQAAELTVVELDWRELEREGPLVPVELTLRFSGDPLKVPILADGLYNLALPLRVELLELRFLEPGFVLGRVVVRFWREPELDPARLPLVEGLDPDLALLAAQVAVAEDCQRALEFHRQARTENHRWLVRALPGLILAGEDGALSASDE